ncbi:hypothetical protein F5X96DRAFT_630134 [Biscogniauxia mediterranea]|nr:hypothetical protein F5X96DRAFT_630134 [Biscogniauxia mediterranea]
MLFRHLSQILAVVGTASAAPKPQYLNFDDVVLFNADGTTNIVKESEYQDLVARGHLDAPAPRSLPPAAAAISSSSSGEKHRRCDDSNEVQITSDTSFLNWDVAMSPVVSAQGGDATVSVASGYSLANDVTVTQGVTVSSLESILQASLQVSYSQTWTSTETQTLLYKVPDGQFGLVVSQPRVRRVQGNYITGCVDDPVKNPFTSDTYTNQTYGNLNWVQGIIRLCNNTVYPVPYCIGEGTHS